MGIARRPNETDEEYHVRHLAYHREWWAKRKARANRPKPQVEEEHVVSVVVPEHVLKERERAFQLGYRSEFSEMLGEPLIRRSAYHGLSHG